MDKIDQQNNVLNLASVLKLLKSNAVLIICVALVALIAGAGVGAFNTYSSISYGGEVEFYLEPGDSTDRLLPILRSDSFAEKLLLDENGLPPAKDCDPADYQAALDAVKAAEEARKYKQDLKNELDKLPYEIRIVEEEYNNIVEEYNRVNSLLNTYKSASDTATSTDDDHKATVSRLTDELEAIAGKRTAYENDVYNPLIQEKLKAELELHNAILDMEEKRIEAEEKSEKLLSAWRTDEEVRYKLSVIKKSITFDYASVSATKDADAGAKTTNTAFLLISVDIYESEELAKELVRKIMTITPDFVEKDIERFTDTNEAKCTLISTFSDANELSAESLVKNIIIYGGIFAIVSILIVAFIVVCKELIRDNSDDDKGIKKNDKKQIAEE